MAVSNFRSVLIYDKTIGGVVKTFPNLHESLNSMLLFFVLTFKKISRYNKQRTMGPYDKMIATSSNDKSIKVIDYSSGKILHTDVTSDDCKFLQKK